MNSDPATTLAAMLLDVIETEGGRHVWKAEEKAMMKRYEAKRFIEE